MDQDVKHLIEENLKISEENNVLLQKLYRVQRMAQITRFVYWFIIIAASLGAFYFIKPFLNNLLSVYTGGITPVINIKEIEDNLSNKYQIEELLNELR